MAYCTLADLTARYGDEIAQVADRDGDGLPDGALVDVVLADVGAEVDGYLATRYQLPLSQAPAILVRLACALARERLLHAAGLVLDADQPARREADAARQTLRDLAAGRAHIGLPQPAAATGGVQMVTGGHDWDRTQSEGFL